MKTPGVISAAEMTPGVFIGGWETLLVQEEEEQ
jgi:hypothetical protein